MARKDWQVTVDFKTEERIDEEAVFDLIEEFADYGASAALSPDGLGGSLTISVSGESAMEALTQSLIMLTDSTVLSGADVSGFEVTDWDEAVRRNREPLFPRVVGYAEIARMTGVSRQRAAKFPKIATFPKPVIETSQGPLYSEDAVAAWAADRKITVGRPKASDDPSSDGPDGRVDESGE